MVIDDIGKMYPKDTYLTKKHLETLEQLRYQSILEAAETLNVSRGTVDNRLTRIRTIVERAQNTVNVANNYKKRSKRLRKLLIRQE